MTEAMQTQVIDGIESDHKDAEKFDLADWLRNGGIKLPQETITIYTDMDNAYQRSLIENKRNDIIAEYTGNLGGVPEDATAELDAKYEALSEAFWAGRIEISMRGVGPAVLKSVARKAQKLKKEGSWDDETYGAYLDQEFIRKSIIAINIPAAKHTINEEMTREGVQEFLDGLPDSESNKVVAMANYLSYGIQLSDTRSDAGFPGGSAESGEEPAVQA